MALGKTVTSVFAVGFGFVSLAPCAHAAEGAVFGGPTGGTDIRNAYLPPTPGFYASLVGVFAGAPDTDNQYGVVSNIDARITNTAAAFGLTYVYDYKFLGWTAATSAQVNYQNGTIAVNSRSASIAGFGDTYVDFLSLSRNFGPLFGEEIPEGSKLPYGLAAKVSYAMIFPTGRYSVLDLTTPGHNDFYFIPNFAMTYLTGPNLIGDGVEISFHTFFDFASTNPVTRYNSGLVIDTDFAITERTGVWQYGLSGYYAQQVQKDYITNPFGIVNGVNFATLQTGINRVSGKYLQQFYLGPVLAYDVPALKATFKIKVQLPIEVRNSFNSTRGTLSVAWAF